MALRDINIARNAYDADIRNTARTEQIGDMLEHDRWYRDSGEELKQYLKSTLITGDDSSDTRINLGVALFDKQGIARVLKNAEASIIINQEAVNPYEVKRKINYYKKNYNIEEGYRQLQQEGFFTKLFSDSNVGTTETIAYENNAGYQIHQTTKQMMDGLTNILNQKGEAVGWDLETTAGLSIGERNIGQHITEFSFVKKNLLTGEQGETFSSVIGATEEEYQEYLDIIEKYEKGTSDKTLRRTGGTPISVEEKITADRLMKMGYVAQMEEQDPGSAIDWTSDRAKKGVINFKKFVGDQEVPIKDPSLMRKGAEFLRQVYQRQEAAGLQDFSFNGQTYEVAGWEAELLQGLQTIQHGGKNGAPLTAVGHNVMTFDINVLNRFFGSDRMSTGGKAAYQAMFKQGLSFDYNLDTISLARRFLPKDFYSEDDLRQMEKLGLTENQQESIVRRLTAYVDPVTKKRDWSRTVYDDPRNAGAAHMAVTDVLRNLEMTESLVFKHDSLLRPTLSALPDLAEEPVAIQGGQRQLFFARSRLNEGRYNLLQLMKDSLSGEFRTADSIAMTESTTREQLFGQFGMQRGVTYEAKRLFSVKTDSKFHDIMKNMYPGLDIDQLTVLELQTYAPDLEGKDIPVRAKSPIYYIGSKQDIANAMMDNTFFVGTVKDDGTVDDSKISDYTKQKLAKITRDAEGNVTRNEFDINEVIADSARRAEQEAAARNIRQHAYSKDRKLLEFLKYEEETVGAISKELATGKREEFNKVFGATSPQVWQRLTSKMIGTSVEQEEAIRTELYKRLWHNSVKISSNLASGGPPINVHNPEFIHSFNRILGFKDKGTETTGNLFSESLTGQMGRLEWARKNKVLLREAMHTAERLGGRNFNAIKYYYTSLMQGLEDYVTADAGKNSSRSGWKLDGVYSYEFDHKFDIDLSGYRGLSKGTIVSLNLESRPENMTEAIIRAAKGELFKAEDYTAAERGAILRDVQDYLYKTRQIGHFADNVRKDSREQFYTDVLDLDKTGYSEQFKQELRSQRDSNISNPFRIREGDSEAVASYKLLRSLQNKRETGDFVGHLTPTYRHMADAAAWQDIIPADKSAREVLDNIAASIPKVSGIFGLDERSNKAVVSESIVNDVVDNVLMESRFTKKGALEAVLEEAGYTTEDITALTRIRELHRQGLRSYVKSVFNMVGNMGGQVGWDKESRRVLAWVGGKNPVDLAMPTETLIDGQLQYRMGPSMLSLPVGIYDLKNGFNDQHELKMTSIIEKAVASNEGLIAWHTRQALLGNGTMRYRLEKAMSSISEIIREAPAVTEVGLTSRGNQFKVQYADLVRNLPALFGKSADSVNGWQTDDAYKNIIKGLATGEITFDKEYPAYEHFLAVQANIDRLLKEAYDRNIIDKKSFEDVISNFTASVKGAAKLAGQAAAQGDFYARWNGTRRNAAGIEDATKLNVSKIAELRDGLAKSDVTADYTEEYGGLRDVGIGKAITDNATYKHSTAGSREGRQLNTHVQLNVLHASPTSLNAVIMDNLGEAVADIYEGSGKVDVISEGSMNLLSTAMPYEGTSFMHGHIFDRIFSERDTIQKLALRKVIDNDNRTIFDLQKKAAAMPSVDITSDGQIKFSYGAGSFVEQGDIIGHVPGFGISPHGERAKYEGILRLGAFDLSNGHLVEEEEISKVVRKELLKEQADIDTFNSLAADVRAKKIVDLLEQKYNLAYYLQTERANPLVKIAEMAEKGMTRALILGTGEADDRIAAVMQELGFYGGNYIAQEKDIAAGRKQITRTLGRVDALDIKLIDDLLRDDLGSFMTAAKGRYSLLNRGRSDYKELDKEAVLGIFKKYHFDDAASFRRAVLHERYEPSRLMAKVLEKAGIVNPDKETFHMITNHVYNMKKHGDISAYRYLTAQWLDMEEDRVRKGGATTEELVKRYLLPENYKGEVTRQGDSVVLSESPEALQGDIRKIRQAYYDTGIVELTDKGQQLSQQEQARVLQKYYDTGDLSTDTLRFSTHVTKEFKLGEGVFKELTNEQGKFVGQYEKTRSDFARVGHYWDWAKETYDAVKFNQRAITVLGNIRADEYGKENIRKFLDERQAVYGKDNIDIYDTFIKGLKKGEIVNSAAIDQIYRNMFNRAGGGEKLSGFTATDSKGNLKWGINEAAVRKFVRDFGVAHGDEEKGFNIMTAMLGRIHQDGMDGRRISTVNEAGAFNLWKAFSATAANSINQGVIQSPREAERLGFKLIKLEDILAGKMGAGDFDQSLYGQNWLIDIGDHSIFKNRLHEELEYNRSGRYIAIAANHIEEPGKFREAIADEPQAKVKQLLDSIDRFRLTADNEGFGSADREREEFGKILQKVQDIKDAQYNIWKGKGGIMAEATKAWMHDAYRATAKGQQFLGTESVDTALGKIKQIDTLTELQTLVQERRTQGKAVDISGLKINGISLVEEARKGAHALQFNYSILSLERMNKIYDQGFGAVSDALVNAGVDKGKVNDLISDMSAATKKIAQTEGVEGISAREPLQYYGSVTQRKIFFNSLAEGNEAIGDFVGAQMRKEDYDSDAVVNALHKEQAELTVGDKKVNIEVDSAMLAALNSQKMKDAGVSVRLLDEGAEERFRNYKVSQFFTGAGEAQRYRTIADFKGGQYDFKSIDSFNFEDLLEKLEPYDEKITQGLNPSTYQTFEERRDVQERVLRGVYRDMVKKASFNYEEFGQDFLMASGETQRIRLAEYLDKQAKAAGKVFGEDFDIAQEALRFSFHDEQLATDMLAHAGRVPTGKMNRYTQNMYDVINEVLHNEGADKFFQKDIGVFMGRLNLVNLAMQEGFLSPKNERLTGTDKGSVEQLRTELMPKLEKAYGDVFSLGVNATAADRAAAKKQLSEAMLNVVLQRAKKEIHRDPTLPTLLDLIKEHGKTYGVNYEKLVTETLGKAANPAEQSVLEQTATAAVNDVADFLVDNIGWTGNERHLFSFGSSHAYGNKKSIPFTFPKHSNQATLQLGVVIGSAMGDLGVDRGVILGEPVGTGKPHGNELDAFAARVTGGKNPPVDISSIPEHDKENIAALKKAVREAKGKTIMGAAIGIAGGLMLSGFANNPTRRQLPPSGAGAAFGNAPIPPQSLPDSATGMAADGSMMSRYPVSFADSNLNVTRGAPSRSYVINISGTSPRGESYAVNAIHSAVAGPIPQNSSINVAMNNNYTDMLSQAQIGRMIQTSLGF